MKTLILASAFALLATAAFAQGPPKFFKDTYPEHALKSALEARGVLQGEGAQLDAKTRELIGLGVAAQIPCTYCVYSHTQNARAKGATEAEIRESVATAATVRQWSTVLNGNAVDFEAFKAEKEKRQASASVQGPPKYLQDTYPEHALKSALDARRVLEGEGAQLDAKTRELIGLGVAAQIPCTYCVYAHTQNARGKGATEAEIREAVATASTVRQWSTVLNGMGYDFEAFKAEVDKRQALK
jgi:AhpD family alkylhydroperoxidase